MTAPSERAGCVDGMIRRSDVVALLKQMAEQHADLALHGDPANAQRREAMEAAFTKAWRTVANMPTDNRRGQQHAYAVRSDNLTREMEKVIERAAESAGYKEFVNRLRPSGPLP